MKQIQRENRVLLDSLLRIDLLPRSLHPSNLWKRRSSTPHQSTSFSRSLNRTTRVKEMSRINKENTTILRRISNVTSVYSHNRWDRDYMQSVQWKNSISQSKSKPIHCSLSYVHRRGAEKKTHGFFAKLSSPACNRSQLDQIQRKLLPLQSLLLSSLQPASVQWTIRQH